MASANIPLAIQDRKHLVKEFLETLPCANQFYVVKNGNVYFQLPNSYQSTNTRIFKGKLHRSNKQVKVEKSEGAEQQQKDKVQKQDTASAKSCEP